MKNKKTNEAGKRKIITRKDSINIFTQVVHDQRTSPSFAVGVEEPQHILQLVDDSCTLV